MKMTKKILLAAVAMAAVMFTGCKKEIGDIEWEKVNDGNQITTYRVNYKNEADYIIRGAKQVAVTKRATATCLVTLENQSTSTKDGVAGFIYGLEKNEETGLLSFLVIGTQNNSGTVRYYASMYYNIDPDKLSADNFGASKIKTAYDANEADPYEIVIKSWTDIGALNTYLTGDKEVKIAIHVTANTTSKEYEFTLKNFKNVEITSGEFQGGSLNDFANKGSEVGSGKVTSEQNGRNEDDSVKGGLYTYANIQPGKTLTAQWDVFDISYDGNRAIVSEEDYSCGDIIWE